MRKQIFIIFVLTLCGILLASVEDKLREGRILFAKGNYRQALEIANEIIETDPHNAPAFHLKGDCWFKIGKKKPALEAFLNAVKYDAKDAEAYLKIGGLYYLDQQVDKAVEYVKKAADLGDKRAINILKRYEEHQSTN